MKKILRNVDMGCRQNGCHNKHVTQAPIRKALIKKQALTYVVKTFRYRQSSLPTTLFFSATCRHIGPSSVASSSPSHGAGRSGALQQHMSKS